MPDLLSCRVALAEYLLPARVDGAVRRFVPDLEETASLYVPPLRVGVAIRLARRRTLHVAVGVARTCSLE